MNGVCIVSKYVCMCIHVLMRDEKEGRKKQARSNKQTNNKAKQHTTPKAVTFPKKNELHKMYIPREGLEPTALYTTCIAITILQIITV